MWFPRVRWQYVTHCVQVNLTTSKIWVSVIPTWTLTVCEHCVQVNLTTSKIWVSVIPTCTLTVCDALCTGKSYHIEDLSECDSHVYVDSMRRIVYRYILPRRRFEWVLFPRVRWQYATHCVQVYLTTSKIWVSVIPTCTLTVWDALCTGLVCLLYPCISFARRRCSSVCDVSLWVIHNCFPSTETTNQFHLFQNIKLLANMCMYYCKVSFEHVSGYKWNQYFLKKKSITKWHLHLIWS